MSSSLSKMLGILDLFAEETPVWSADAICERLGFSTSSGYRYIRELCDAGLLTRMTGGAYALGARIIELEFVMQRADPVARVGRPVLKQLTAATGCDALLSNFHGTHVINILHERGVEDLQVTYTRGRQHPLFKGAVAKAILPHLRRPQLVRIYERNQQAISEAGMGDTWLEFWRHLQAIKRRGFSESHGELDPQLSGLGVPVFANDGILGSLSLAYTHARAKLLNRDGLVEQMQIASRQLTEAIEASYQSPSH
ncbi:MAG: helix-turn-helix domain-containing protein [Burkholderiales bacterium]|nr:helix-turn-helix domain-containing protein [Burkholderiales bacterium]